MNADRRSRTPRDYRTFAWQGISLTVPRTWDLVFCSGQYRAGYVRLADQEAVRMEMRWQTGSADRPPAEAVDAYIARLEKQASRGGRTLSVQRGLRLASPPGKQVECYRWLDRRQGVAMLSRCRDCGRTVHVQLLGEREEALRGLARTAFSSLRDHPDGPVMPWDFFDVRFETPVGLPLSGASLMAGCVRMRFGRGLMRMEFVRLSLAETLLAGRDLIGWFREFYGARFRRRRVRMDAVRVGQHPAVRASGRPWLLCNPLRLIGRGRVTRALCWHCETTNRLMICSFDGPEEEAEDFESAADSFHCCENA